MQSLRTHSEYGWLVTRAHIFTCALGLILVIVIAAPGADLVKTLVGLTAFIGTVAAILFLMTFWAKVRVRACRNGRSPSASI